MKDVNCTEIVIRIPDRIHYGIENGITVNGSIASQIVLDAVKNGTPLPKGHGRLIDEDEILGEMRSTFDAQETYQPICFESLLDSVSAIIKADTGCVADKEVDE